MTLKEAKTDIKFILRAARGARREIEEIDERIEAAQEKLYKCTSQAYTEGTSKTNGKSVEDRYINTITYIALLEERRDKRHKQLNKVIELINLLSDDRLVRVMTHYYIDGLTWEKTAEKIGMSEYWVRTTLHSRALKEIREKML